MLINFIQWTDFLLHVIYFSGPLTLEMTVDKNLLLFCFRSNQQLLAMFMVAFINLFIYIYFHIPKANKNSLGLWELSGVS